MTDIFGEPEIGSVGELGVTVRYLTPHNVVDPPEYQDNLFMLSSRGGQGIWMFEKDAAKVGIKDNDWIEAVNRNGVVNARAIVSHRMPEGTVYMHHAQDRLIDVPGRRRPANAVASTTRSRGSLMKPSHLIGGYAQLSFAFNYLGPTGNQRDEVTVIRRRSQRVEYRGSCNESSGADGDGDEPRQVHRVPHVFGDVQTGLDQPGRHGVRLVQQRRDPSGAGLPRTYEDQEVWKGGWIRTSGGRLRLKGGGRFKLATIFSNPKLPSIEDYYEPWTYDYATLINAPAQDIFPVARPYCSSPASR
jgi:nitrate reductase alpha subunit